MARSAQVGVTGLAVMGRNLALNMADHGFTVAVYNRTAARTEEFVAGPGRNTGIVGAYSLQEFAGWLDRPRKVSLMVKAGRPVDTVIGELRPYLERGDIVVDGGNSHFLDTIRRARELEAEGRLAGARRPRDEDRPSGYEAAADELVQTVDPCSSPFYLWRCHFHHFCLF